MARKRPGNYKKCLLIGFMGGLILTASLYKLSTIPPVWWDEGWNLAVARNWVAEGHYGQMLVGEPRSAGLSGSFAMIVPLAISFRLLGIGVWQARIVGVLFLFGSYLWFACLAARLFNPRVGFAAILITIIAPIEADIQPLLIGRQVLGEMPMIFFLLTGYGFLYLALEKRPGYILAAALAWGIAYRTKAQVPPFLLASLIIPLIVALLKKSWRMATLLAVGLIGLWLTSVGIPLLQHLILGDGLLSNDPVPGLYQVTALVLDMEVRQVALGHIFSFGLPTVIGACYGAWLLNKEFRTTGEISGRWLVRLALLSLVGSWLAWYVLLGMYWKRYLFPPIFIGSLFAAAALADWTSGFNLKSTFQKILSTGGPSEHETTGKLALLTGLIMAMWIGYAALATALMMIQTFIAPGMEWPGRVTNFLDQEIAAGAIIETYDSEILFLSDHLFHFPPDLVHVQMVEREKIDPQAPVAYDPLAADPDYLIVGPFSREYHLYDSVIEAGHFELVQGFPEYEIYQRAPIN